MKYIFLLSILSILFLFIMILFKNNKVEYYSNIHGNKFWNFWDTPNYNKIKKYPLWRNIYWGPSYWPGGKNIINKY